MYLVVDIASPKGSCEALAQAMRRTGALVELVEHDGIPYMVWETRSGERRPPQILGREIQPISRSVLERTD